MDDGKGFLALLEKIEKRRELYDPSAPHYKKRNKVDNTWREIAQELGVSESACKEKWRYIRVSFMNNLKYSSKQFYMYDKMKFVLPFLKLQKKSQTKTPIIELSETDDDFADESVDLIDDVECTDEIKIENYDITQSGIVTPSNLSQNCYEVFEISSPRTQEPAIEPSQSSDRINTRKRRSNFGIEENAHENEPIEGVFPMPSANLNNTAASVSKHKRLSDRRAVETPNLIDDVECTDEIKIENYDITQSGIVTPSNLSQNCYEVFEISSPRTQEPAIEPSQSSDRINTRKRRSNFGIEENAHQNEPIEGVFPMPSANLNNTAASVSKHRRLSDRRAVENHTEEISSYQSTETSNQIQIPSTSFAVNCEQKTNNSSQIGQTDLSVSGYIPEQSGVDHPMMSFFKSIMPDLVNLPLRKQRVFKKYSLDLLYSLYTDEDN